MADQPSRGARGHRGKGQRPKMTVTRISLLCSAAAFTLAACGDFDLDMRTPDSGFNTSDAARQATASRPRADGRGVISYPDYQVVVARGGDSVQTVAERIGMSARELASFNALTPETTLRAGEVLALPSRVGDGPSATDADRIDVSTLADTAIARAEGRTPDPAPTRTQTQPASAQPTQHRVARGETAFQIARLYNVTPRALADWNGLDPEMRVREGQVLMIPVAADVAADRAGASPEPQREDRSESVPQPGAGSATPTPPSARAPLPDPEPSADEAEVAAQEARPPSPSLSEERTDTTRPQFAMPVDGRIIRAYGPPRSEGIGIAASAGTDVKAAAAGTVSRIVRTTNDITFVIVSHGNQLSTVYANVADVAVSEGARVTQGQTLAKVAGGESPNLHFEVRRGTESQDPMRFLQ